MKMFFRICLLFIVFVGIFYYFTEQSSQNDAIKEMEVWSNQNSFVLDEKKAPSYVIEKGDYEAGFFSWIGKDKDHLQASFGEPLRKDASRYGYTWWIYTGIDYYLQFGVDDNEVVTVFATGNSDLLTPLEIGEDYQTIEQRYGFNDTVSFASYSFQLVEDDIKTRPLVQIKHDQYLQLYFDTFTNTLSSFRLMTADVLLKQQPYALRYVGTLPKQANISTEKWQEIASGEEQQVYQITNVIRNRFNEAPVQWHDAAQVVAYRHSRDMAENEYFAHVSEDGRTLGDRLAEEDINFRFAGENIAAMYPDAPAVVEGWLNSRDGHREALLETNFTDLGVGVFREHYTQNFLQVE